MQQQLTAFAIETLTATCCFCATIGQGRRPVILATHNAAVELAACEPCIDAHIYGK